MKTLTSITFEREVEICHTLAGHVAEAIASGQLAEIEAEAKLLKHHLSIPGCNVPNAVAAMIDELRAAYTRIYRAEYSSALEAVRASRCPACVGKLTYRKNRVLLECVREEGYCYKCGEESPVVLQFHHVDPTTKWRDQKTPRGQGDGVAGRAGKGSWRKTREEIEKCILLCANCHLKIEAGVVELPAPILLVVSERCLQRVEETK